MVSASVNAGVQLSSDRDIQWIKSNTKIFVHAHVCQFVFACKLRKKENEGKRGEAKTFFGGKYSTAPISQRFRVSTDRTEEVATRPDMVKIQNRDRQLPVVFNIQFPLHTKTT